MPKKTITLLAILSLFFFPIITSASSLTNIDHNEDDKDISNTDKSEFQDTNQNIHESSVTDKVTQEDTKPTDSENMEFENNRQEDNSDSIGKFENKEVLKQEETTETHIDNNVDDDNSSDGNLLEENQQNKELTKDNKEQTSDQEKDNDNGQTQSSTYKANNKSVDELYDEAMSESTASGRVAKFIIALEIYENNDKLLEGLNKSVENLISWASNQHTKGNFETALDRYNDIIALNVIIDQHLLDEAEWKKSFAVKGMIYPTADRLYNQAMQESSASRKLELFIEGYELYSNDNRFVIGIENSATSLLVWARRQHQSDDYATAINRYEKILNAPVLSKILELSVNKHLSLAKNGKRIPLLNDLIRLINQQKTVSNIFNQSNEAYILYPENKQIKDQLNYAARLLLDWALGQHEKGNFLTAIQRYEMITAASYIDQNIWHKAETLLKDAEISKRSADTIYNEALAENRATYKLNLFIEGYKFYPNDNRFKNGIGESANSLFNWAINKHHEGEFDTAIQRYEYILEAPTLSKDLKKEVEKKLKDARIGKRPADVIYGLIKKETTASGQFELNSEGYRHYKNDNRFIDGLSKASKNLLDLAIRYHDNNNFSGALSRYEKLQSTEGVPAVYQDVSEVLSLFVEKDRQFPDVEQIDQYAKENPTVSGIFKSYIAGYYLYPNSEKIINGMGSSSLIYYDYAFKKHDSGDYGSAISRYNKLITTPGVPGWIVKIVNQNLDRAKNGKSPESQFVQHKEYHISLEEALNIQMLASPQTDKYSSKPAYISDKDIKLLEVKITGKTVNLRNSPSLNSKVITTARKDATFEFIREVTGDLHEKSKVWYEVRYNNVKLYVHSSLATIFIETIQTSKIHAETRPSSHVYGTILGGRKVEVVSLGNNWHQVKYGEWRNPTKDDLKEYLDPNNFILDNKQLFQFLDLSKPSGVTGSILNKYLNGKGTLEQQGRAFIEAGGVHGVNEIYLLSHALLETGNGTSDLAKGIEVGKNSKNELVLVTASNRKNLTEIKKVYNMFGIGAIDKNPKVEGAKRAYREGWTTPEKAIVGGAAFIGNGYVNAGQNTLYKMRWNPEAMVTNGVALHQYATDIGWAYKQVGSIFNIYQELDSYILHLDIPIYK